MTRKKANLETRTFHYYEWTLDEDCSFSHAKMFGQIEKTLKKYGTESPVDENSSQMVGMFIRDGHNDGVRMYVGTGFSALYARKRVCLTVPAEMTSYDSDAYSNFASVSVSSVPKACPSLLEALEKIQKEHPPSKDAQTAPRARW